MSDIIAYLIAFLIVGAITLGGYVLLAYVVVRVVKAVWMGE